MANILNSTNKPTGGSKSIYPIQITNNEETVLNDIKKNLNNPNDIKQNFNKLILYIINKLMQQTKNPYNGFKVDNYMLFENEEQGKNEEQGENENSSINKTLSKISALHNPDRNIKSVDTDDIENLIRAQLAINEENSLDYNKVVPVIEEVEGSSQDENEPPKKKWDQRFHIINRNINTGWSRENDNTVLESLIKNLTNTTSSTNKKNKKKRSGGTNRKDIFQDIQAAQIHDIKPFKTYADSSNDKFNSLKYNQTEELIKKTISEFEDQYKKTSNYNKRVRIMTDLSTILFETKMDTFRSFTENAMQKIYALTKEKDDLTKEKDNNDELEELLEKKREVISNQHKMLNELSARGRENQEQIKKLKLSLKENSSERKILSDTNEELIEENQKIVSQLDAQNTQIREMTSKISVMEQNNESQKSIIESTENEKIISLSGELDKISQLNENYKKLLKIINLRLDNQDKAVELLRVTNTTLTETIESQEDNYETIKKNLEDLNKIGQEKQQKIDHLMSEMTKYKKICKTQISQLEKVNKELQQKIKGLEDKISKLQLSITTLESSKSVLEKSIGKDREEFSKEYEVLTENIERLTAENQELSSRNQEMQSNNQRERDKLLRKKDELVREKDEKCESEKKEIKEENQKIKAENDKIKAENEEIKEENEEIKEENQKIKEENEEIKEDNEGLKRTHKVQIGLIKNQLDIQKRENDDLKKEKERQLEAARTRLAKVEELRSKFKREDLRREAYNLPPPLPPDAASAASPAASSAASSAASAASPASPRAADAASPRAADADAVAPPSYATALASFAIPHASPPYASTEINLYHVEESREERKVYLKYIIDIKSKNPTPRALFDAKSIEDYILIETARFFLQDNINTIQTIASDPNKLQHAVALDILLYILKSTVKPTIKKTVEVMRSNYKDLSNIDNIINTPRYNDYSETSINYILNVSNPKKNRKFRDDMSLETSNFFYEMISFDMPLKADTNRAEYASSPNQSRYVHQKQSTMGPDFTVASGHMWDNIRKTVLFDKGGAQGPNLEIVAKLKVIISSISTHIRGMAIYFLGRLNKQTRLGMARELPDSFLSDAFKKFNLDDFKNFFVGLLNFNGETIKKFSKSIEKHPQLIKNIQGIISKNAKIRRGGSSSKLVHSLKKGKTNKGNKTKRNKTTTT